MNLNICPSEEQPSVPQQSIDIILKLHKAGRSPEIISSMLGFSLPHVLRVLGLRNDENKGMSFVELYAQRSNKFRCAFSGRLMASPVISPDGRLYEQSSLSSANLKYSEERLLVVPYIKDEIQIFSRSTLQQLEFSSAQISKDALTIAVECLSVLDINQELETFLKVLAPLSKANLGLALSMLRRTVPEEGLLSLLTQLQNLQDFQMMSLLLVKELMLQPLRHFEAVFNCFVKVLSQAALCPEALDLMEELKIRLDAEQLIQVIEALSLHERDKPTQLKIDELKLKVAYHKKDDKAAALSLLKSLYPKPEMKEKLVEFFQATGWGEELTEYYRANFERCLGSLREPNVVEVLGSLFQFFSQKLEVSIDSQRQIYLAELDAAKREINQVLNEQIGYLRPNLRQIDQRFRQEAPRRRAPKDIVDLESLIHAPSFPSPQHVLASRSPMPQVQSSPIDQPNVRVPFPFQKKIDQLIQAISTPTYSYKKSTGDLHITDLRTGTSTVNTIPSFIFKDGCSWCPLPQSSLCFTGGPYPNPCKEVVTIDSTSFSVATKSPMLTGRYAHQSVYHRGYVYVIGGKVDKSSMTKNCERYSANVDRWGAIPPLPTAVSSFGLVTQETTQSLYVIGNRDLIQELKFDRLEWTTLAVKLPSTDSNGLPVFKVSEQEFFLVHQNNLYAFSPSAPELRLVKTLSAVIKSWRGPSYYSNGTLYCSNDAGAVLQLAIGALS